MRVADGTQWDGSDVEFTASGPPNEGQTDRWSKTFSYEIKKDAREGRRLFRVVFGCILARIT